MSCTPDIRELKSSHRILLNTTDLVLPIVIIANVVSQLTAIISDVSRALLCHVLHECHYFEEMCHVPQWISSLKHIGPLCAFRVGD